MIQFEGQKCVCLHCNKCQSNNVEDYSIPFLTGAESAAVDECEYCNKQFEVIAIDEKKYEVSK